MKRFRLFIVLSLVFAFSTLVLVGLAHAQGFHTGGNITLPEGQTNDGSFYSTGRTLDIAGTVNGDIFCAGQSVTISGTVHGDVLCAGQTVDITGSVDGNIRVVGQTVDLTGLVGHNVSVLAQTFSTHATTKILGDLSFAGNSMSFGGSVGRDLVATGKNIVVGGSIGRNVKANTPDLAFTSNAKVGGSANYISDNTASVASGATVKQLSRTTPSASSHHRFGRSLLGIGLIGFGYILLSALFGALVLILLLPKTFHNITEEAVKHLGRTILTGLIASVAVPVLIIALMITVIGIPFASLLLLIWLVMVCLSLPIMAYYLGSMILAKVKNPIPIMLLGTVLLVILLFLPFIGVVISFISLWIGTGCLLRVLKQHWPKPQYKL